MIPTVKVEIDGVFGTVEVLEIIRTWYGRPYCKVRVTTQETTVVTLFKGDIIELKGHWEGRSEENE